MEEILKNLSPAKNQKPAKGWIRSIREALGMSGRQLADRIKVETSRISELEKAEIHGNITLKSLRRVAEAMGCDLVYGIVPKTNLEDFIRIQAEKAVNESLKTISHTMRLEDQGLPPNEDAKLFSKLVEDWTKDPPRWLWDSK